MSQREVLAGAKGDEPVFPRMLGVTGITEADQQDGEEDPDPYPGIGERNGPAAGVDSAGLGCDMNAVYRKGIREKGNDYLRDSRGLRISPASRNHRRWFCYAFSSSGAA
jgi:hypothetical protein